MRTIRLITCAFLTLVISHSQAWAESAQINSYPALRAALEQGEVPIKGVIDFAQCSPESEGVPRFRGKEITVFNRNTLNADGLILMLTTYKLSTRLVSEAMHDTTPDREELPAWLEWQSAYTLSKESAGEFDVRFIAADAKTGKTIVSLHFKCPLGTAVKLWRTPHL
ncbi:VirK family protein [Endozoicomonas sp. 4G]|uniref:VirK family protein n=1 Tax=Endozoicomonas sp. 4G TaxID=2872754 RepID=UPI002078A897|nr:VirK family protein [Endozoicomonas sp. 4G]